MPRKRRIEIEDLFRLRVVTGADAAPDGSRIVYSLQRQDLKGNKTYSSLYAVPAGGGRIRRLTRGNHGDRRPRFSPDGRTLAFLSNRDKTSAVWLLPLDGGEARRLTDRDSHVLDFDWSPDGKHVVVARRALSDREKLERDGKSKELERLPHFRHVTRLRHRMDGEGYWSGEYVHIHLVRVSSGKSTPLTSSDHDDVEPRFSPDGLRVSFLSNRAEDPDLFAENSDIYTVGVDGTRLRKATREPGPAFGHSWAPDGKSIVYLGHLGGPCEWNKHDLHVRRVAAGGGPSRDLTPDLGRQATNNVIGDVAGTAFGGPNPVVSPDGERVFFVLTDRGLSRLASVEFGGGETTFTLGEEHTVLDFGIARGGAAAWVVAGDLVNPCDVHRLMLDGTDGAVRRLTKVNEAVLRGLDIVEPEEITYPRKGGKIHGWILRPPGFRKGARYPAVLEVHGGPHVCYGRVFFHEMQLLAAKGYVVLMTNPRGSDGYGLEHRTAIQGAYGTVDADDLMAAVDGLLRREPIDRDRVFLTGGSYGGYMTNWLVAHTNRFRAAVTQRSVVSFDSFFGTSDIGYRFGPAELEGLPWDVPERYEGCSPLTHASRVETPLLILHSESDLRCPIGQGEELFTKLKMLGKEVEMVRFVGESHGLSRGGKPRNRAERLRRILEWFRRYGGR